MYSERDQPYFMPLMASVAVVMYVATAVFAVSNAPLQAIVTLIAGTAYATMFFSQGQSYGMSGSSGSGSGSGTTKTDQPMPQRYADWVLTTPLLLFILLKPDMKLAPLVLIMAMDAAMVYSGYASAYGNTVAEQATWFALGCIFFIPVLFALVNSERYRYAALITFVLWLAYPVLHGLRYLNYPNPIIGTRGYDIAISVLDVSAKVGIGALTAYSGLKIA